MATFPRLVPVSRTFTAATYPGAVQLAYSGRESRVRTSNAQTGARFRLAFSALSDAEMLSIRDHYYGQLGRFRPFQLSAELLSGMANPSAVTPTGYQWIYVASPKVTDLPAGTAEARSCLHDVELELEMVPEVSVFLSGESWQARAAIAGGAANSGDLALPGATWSAAATISGGAAAVPDVSVSGAAWVTPADITGGAADGGAAADPYFPNVTLLLHMNGSNGGTTFVDDSNVANVITASGNAQISTAQTKWGVSSASFNGNTNSYLTIPANAGLDFGSGAFTIEFFAYINSFATFQYFWSSRTADYTNGIVLRMSSGGQMQCNNYGPGAWWTKDGTGFVPAAQWFHYAMTRSGDTIKLWLNGTLDGTITLSSGFSMNSGDPVRLGRELSGNVEGWPLNGYIDELRVTKGVARYTSNFTPPTAAFPNG